MANASHSSTGIGSTGLTGLDAAIDGITAITWRSGSGGIDEMANPRPIPAHPGDLDGLPVSRLEDLALDVPLTQAPGTDEIPDGTLAVEEDLGAVELPYEYGDWQDDYADAVCVSRWREL